MKKILVTGATGFIGGYVIRELLGRGYAVVATSADAAKAAQQPWYSRVIYRPLDLAKLDDSSDYYSYFDKPDRLIHLAWEGLPDYKNRAHLDLYLPRHERLLFNLALHGLRNITVAGTCLEYGMQEGCLDESMEAMPQLPYPIAKDNLRKYLEAIIVKFGGNLKWLRLFYMYGRGQNPKSLFSQLEQAVKEGREAFNMSPGEQQRDFLPVEKMAEYIVSVALQDNITGIINCCSGKPVSVKDFVQGYLDGCHSKMKLNTGYYGYTDYEPMSFWGDITKLQQALNQGA